MAKVFAVIMAGGRGERLWPLSTSERPKQFLNLGGRRTMLQETVFRIGPLIPPGHTYVVVPKEFAHIVRKQLAIPHENILVEPMGRNTAPCLGLAAVILAAKDPQAVMVVLPADHVIQDHSGFLTILEAAVKAAEDGGHLVTLGIIPDRPATGYGYIRRGELIGERDEVQTYDALQFVEKPDRATAERFLAEGTYLWNSGMFMWRVDTILRAIEEHLPRLYAGLMEIKASLEKPNLPEVVDHVYCTLDGISIDKGVMEKAKNVLVIPADIGWSDVGDWSALDAVIPLSPEGNVVHGRHVGVETEGCIVYAGNPERLVATLGVRNLVIVETERGILVMPKARAQEVRRILDLLRNEEGEK